MTRHYEAMAVQPWDVMDTWPKAEAAAFYRGSVVKYVMRAGHKGDALSDARKALHCCQKWIETLEGADGR